MLLVGQFNKRFVILYAINLLPNDILNTYEINILYLIMKIDPAELSKSNSSDYKF